VVALTDSERTLLDRIAAEGKATRLTLGDLQAAKSLEADGLLFMVRNTLDAIITPKGRRLLAELAQKPPKPPRPPFNLLK
jgi:hypothetical protein